MHIKYNISDSNAAANNKTTFKESILYQVDWLKIYQIININFS